MSKHRCLIINFVLFCVWRCDNCRKWGIGPWRHCVIDVMIHQEGYRD